MDIFKAMGITVGNDIKMIDEIKTSSLSKSDESSQIVRKGMDVSARDRLEGQIEKGFSLSRAPQYAPGHEGKNDYDGSLKNTHGEDWHSDNDKQVEELLSSAEPVDREFAAEGKENTKTPRHPGTYAPTGEQRHQIEFKSMPQEDLFKKAFDFDEDEEKDAPKEEAKDGAKKEGKKNPHPGLNKVDGNPVMKNANKACKSELDEIFDLVKSFPVLSTRVPKRAKVQPKDPVQQKQERDQKKQLLGKWAKKSVSDWEQAYENGTLMAIAPDPYAAAPELIATVHENSEDVTQKIRPAAPFEKASKFIKAMGPGGVIFDFGAMTGNPIADQATRLLNENVDSVQASNAKYTEGSYNKALTEYVNKGDAQFAQQATMFGNVDKEWTNQLNKPMDQQVKEAFQKGELSSDPNAPAIKNDFNKTEITLGGQIIKATSETDALLIEMMRAQDASMPSDGMIADATTGGRVSITAGEPLPQN